MIDTTALGWPPALVGELDHHRLKAPSLKLRSARTMPHGDTLHAIDLRVSRPNTGASLPTATAHSFEHFLLEGFSRLLPAHFVSVGVMGCRTGFYLTLAGEGRAAVVCDTLARVLEGMVTATAVPYANAVQCGHWRDHDLAAAQRLAHDVLARRRDWLDAA